MSSNFAEFDRRIKRHEREVGLRVAERHREIALRAVEIAVEESPVKTGAFRGAWRVSESREMEAPHTPDKEGRATVARARRALEGLRPFALVYVVNAMPYAGRIEHGWSAQAPQGVMGVTAERLKAEIGRGR